MNWDSSMADNTKTKGLYELPGYIAITVCGFHAFSQKDLYVSAYSRNQATELIRRQIARQWGVDPRDIDFDGGEVERTIRIEHIYAADLDA